MYLCVLSTLEMPSFCSLDLTVKEAEGSQQQEHAGDETQNAHLDLLSIHSSGILEHSSLLYPAVGTNWRQSINKLGAKSRLGHWRVTAMQRLLKVSTSFYIWSSATVTLSAALWVLSGEGWALHTAATSWRYYVQPHVYIQSIKVFIPALLF